jgi:hypothetical protein
MGCRFALLGRLRHSRKRIDRGELVGDLTTIGRHADAKIETMGMLRAMVRFNVTPGKRLNNPPSDDSAFEVHLRFDSEAECVAYADMRPWPNRPVQQTVPLGSENFQLHIVEVALQQFVKECSGTRRRPSAAIKRTGADLGDESRSRAWHVDGGLDRSKLGASFRAPIPITLQSATGDSSIGVCTTPARLLLWRAPMRTVEGRHPTNTTDA